MVAGVHSYSVLTLSTPEPLTFIFVAVEAPVNAAAVIDVMNLGLAIAFQKEIDTKRVDGSFIPMGIENQMDLL